MPDTPPTNGKQTLMKCKLCLKLVNQSDLSTHAQFHREKGDLKSTKVAAAAASASNVTSGNAGNGLAKLPNKAASVGKNSSDKQLAVENANPGAISVTLNTDSSAANSGGDCHDTVVDNTSTAPGSSTGTVVSEKAEIPSETVASLAGSESAGSVPTASNGSYTAVSTDTPSVNSVVAQTKTTSTPGVGTPSVKNATTSIDGSNSTRASVPTGNPSAVSIELMKAASSPSYALKVKQFKHVNHLFVGDKVTRISKDKQKFFCELCQSSSVLLGLEAYSNHLAHPTHMKNVFIWMISSESETISNYNVLVGKLKASNKPIGLFCEFCRKASFNIKELASHKNHLVSIKHREIVQNVQKSYHTLCSDLRKAAAQVKPSKTAVNKDAPSTTSTTKTVVQDANSNEVKLASRDINTKTSSKQVKPVKSDGKTNSTESELPSVEVKTSHRRSESWSPVRTQKSLSPESGEILSDTEPIALSEGERSRPPSSNTTHNSKHGRRRSRSRHRHRSRSRHRHRSRSRRRSSNSRRPSSRKSSKSPTRRRRRSNSSTRHRHRSRSPARREDLKTKRSRRSGSTAGTRSEHSTETSNLDNTELTNTLHYSKSADRHSRRSASQTSRRSRSRSPKRSRKDSASSRRHSPVKAHMDRRRSLVSPLREYHKRRDRQNSSHSDRHSSPDVVWQPSQQAGRLRPRPLSPWSIDSLAFLVEKKWTSFYEKYYTAGMRDDALCLTLQKEYLQAYKGFFADDPHFECSYPVLVKPELLRTMLTERIERGSPGPESPEVEIPVASTARVSTPPLTPYDIIEPGELIGDERRKELRKLKWDMRMSEAPPPPARRAASQTELPQNLYSSSKASVSNSRTPVLQRDNIYGSMGSTMPLTASKAQSPPPVAPPTDSAPAQTNDFHSFERLQVLIREKLKLPTASPSIEVSDLVKQALQNINSSSGGPSNDYPIASTSTRGLVFKDPFLGFVHNVLSGILKMTGLQDDVDSGSASPTALSELRVEQRRMHESMVTINGHLLIRMARMALTNIDRLHSKFGESHTDVVGILKNLDRDVLQLIADTPILKQ